MTLFSLGNSTAIQEIFKRISEQFGGMKKIDELGLCGPIKMNFESVFSYVPAKSFPPLVHWWRNGRNGIHWGWVKHEWLDKVSLNFQTYFLNLSILNSLFSEYQQYQEAQVETEFDDEGGAEETAQTDTTQ